MTIEIGIPRTEPRTPGTPFICYGDGEMKVGIEGTTVPTVCQMRSAYARSRELRGAWPYTQDHAEVVPDETRPSRPLALLEESIRSPLFIRRNSRGSGSTDSPDPQGTNNPFSLDLPE